MTEDFDRTRPTPTDAAPAASELPAGPEMDEAVATAMGWRADGNGMWYRGDEETGWLRSHPVPAFRTFQSCPFFAPSRDIAAAYEMEAEIERRGLTTEYADALADIVMIGGCVGEPPIVAGCAFVAPLDRCRAALAAFKKEGPMTDEEIAELERLEKAATPCECAECCEGEHTGQCKECAGWAEH